MTWKRIRNQPTNLQEQPTASEICRLAQTYLAVEMDKFAPSTSDRSRSGTPANSRFTAQAETAEDLLKSQTVGLVHLGDFRKRRAEALEQKERSASGSSTPQDGHVSLGRIIWSDRANLQSTG